MTVILNFLNGISLERLRVRAEVSGLMVIFILLLDLHRFGAWYTGNQCHLKPYGLSILFIAGLPAAFYTLALAVQKIVSKGWFMFLYMFRINLFFLVPGMCNPVTIKSVFNEPVWYDQSILRPVDLAFMKGIAVMLLLSAVYTAVFILPIWILAKTCQYLSKFEVVKRIWRFLD